MLNCYDSLESLLLLPSCAPNFLHRLSQSVLFLYLKCQIGRIHIEEDRRERKGGEEEAYLKLKIELGTGKGGGGGVADCIRYFLSK